jgi:cytochrome c biogenesis factor
MAAIVAVWGLIKGAFLKQLAWPLALLAVAAAVAWSVSRPGGGWKRPWMVAAGLALVTLSAVFATVGRQAPGFAIAVGLSGAMVIGLAVDVVRLRAARGYPPDRDPDRRIQEGTILHARAGRRRSSALAHLGIALIAAGISAEALTSVDTRPLSPGDTVTVAARLGSQVRVRYLGLSRYQVDEREKRVASFTLYRGDAAPRLVTAATIFDMTTRRESNTPAVIRGALRDVIVEVAGRTEAAEGILCRASSRPLAGLVWLGGIVLLVSIIPTRRPRR